MKRKKYICICKLWNTNEEITQLQVTPIFRPHKFISCLEKHLHNILCLYKYIYMYPFTKTFIYISEIYIIYMYECRKKTKVDTHYTSPVVWPLLAIFSLDMQKCLFWCWQKRYRPRKGIINNYSLRWRFNSGGYLPSREVYTTQVQ